MDILSENTYQACEVRGGEREMFGKFKKIGKLRLCNYNFTSIEFKRKIQQAENLFFIRTNDYSIKTT